MSPLSKKSFFRSSFQLKLFLYFTLISAITSSILCFIYITSEIREKRINVQKELNMTARHLADTVRLPLFAENSEALQHIAETIASMPEITSVVISNNNGKVIAGVQKNGKTMAHTISSETVEVRTSSLVTSPESALSGTSDTAAQLIGTVRLERGDRDLRLSVDRLIVISIVLACMFWALVSAVCYLVLRRVTDSFNVLISGIAMMQNGDLNHRILIESNDETGRAAVAVNALAESLQRRNEENILLQEERLNRERQMLHTQKLESLGVMAGGIAHDFNNLLQAIIGNMELALIKLPTDSDSRKCIVNAMNSSNRAAQLSRLMLTYTGKGFISKKMLNLNEIVKENEIMMTSFASSSVSLELKLAERLPLINADEAQLQQVVMNLITNAAESIVESPGFVRVITGVRDCDQCCLDGSLLVDKPKPGRFVFLTVRDNGCGMSEEIIKRLFDPFFTTKFTGRGLGMSAVMGIIQSHSGALLVESLEGEGTTFTVLFPVSDTAVAEQVTDPVDSVSPAVPHNADLSGTALVVDDEKSVLRVVTKMVKLSGFSVIQAYDGIDAVSKFREHCDDIALVIMDLTMPNMDGITAMNEIYSIKPDARVILSSGFNKDELRERITNQPPAGFIRKPYTLNVLEAELKRVMQLP